jgi:hypothetical protein
MRIWERHLVASSLGNSLSAPLSDLAGYLTHRICMTFELRTGSGRKFSAEKAFLYFCAQFNSSTEIIRSVPPARHSAVLAELSASKRNF